MSRPSNGEFTTLTPGERDGSLPAGIPRFVGRYQLERRIGQGGMGDVILGRDVELGRRVALKVLLEKYRDSPEMVLQFVEEAQIGGQLAHPAIVPVHEMGTLPDGRPFFVMKLVEGRTLSDLLRSRSGPAEDLPRHLSIFEQVAQAMAYAHAQGVIHRDLKPLNIMVGAFAEVQTMDWGMAKLHSRKGRPEGDPAIRMSRSRTSATVAGVVKGTPNYMPPEQARGEVDRLDERADVFALGAILCEILTGRPPYLGETTLEILEKAATGDLADALARLDASDADAELLDLARTCLAPGRDDRPRDAGEVAAAMAAYAAGVQERLRLAELDRVAAEARAEGEAKRRRLADELTIQAEAQATSERKRRRATMALAASLLLLFGLGSVVAGWIRDREVVASRAYEEGIAQRGRALADIQNPASWSAAIETAKRAEGLLGFGVSGGTRRRVLELRNEVEQARDLLDSLLDNRIAAIDDEDRHPIDAAYIAAFRKAGIDADSSSPADVMGQMQIRPREVVLAMATALDDWAAVRRSMQDLAGAKRLTAVTKLADPDPWRISLRDALDIEDERVRRDALRALADSARLDELDAISLQLLGTWLTSFGHLDAAERVLRAGQRRYPRDVWLNRDLAECLNKLNRREESIRYYAAARALRPETSEPLARLLEEKGETDEAIAVLRDLNRLRPKRGGPLFLLGTLLKDRGRPKEADEVFKASVSAFREEIRQDPKNNVLHDHLGLTLKAQGKQAEAIAEHREAIRIKPDDPGAHINLGIVLSDQGKLDEAIVEHREAIRIKPDDQGAHANLGIVLSDQGKLDEAIAEYRQAIKIKPDDANSHNNLGNALRSQGKPDEAIAEYRKAIRIKPDDANAHRNLGHALKARGEADEALFEYREAVRSKPDHAAARQNLGNMLADRGMTREAIDEYREAIRIKPESAEAHNNLALALQKRGKLVEAIAEHREAIRIKPEFAEAHGNMGTTLEAQDKVDEAIAEYREAIRIKPDHADAHINLGSALIGLGRIEEAVAECREGVRLKPEGSQAHLSLGGALRAQGKLEEAITECREGVRLKPENAMAHNNLANVLRAQGKVDEAIAEYREAIRFDRNHAEAHNNLGNALSFLKKFDEALFEYREAIRINPGQAEFHNNLATVLDAQGKFDEAIAEYREAIRIKPDLVFARYNLGKILHNRRKLGEATAEYRETIRLKPDFAEAYNNLGLTLRDQSNVDDAIVEFRKAVRLKPEFVLARFNLAHALNLRGKLDEAGEEYRETIRIKPNDANSHNNLGGILNTQGKTEEAIAEFREAIRIKPGFGQAHINLARLLLNQPDPKKRDVPDALKHARIGVELEPNNWIADVALGEGEYRSEHWEASITAMKRSCERRNGGTGGEWFYLAMAHRRLGQEPESREWFDKAVAWTREKAPNDATLRALWTEAADLVGMPKPPEDSAGR